MTRPTFGISLLLIASAALTAPRADAAERTVYFSPKGGAARAITAAIDKAKKSIDVAIYSIGENGGIAKALARACEREVRVRMVLHKGTTTNKSTARAFAARGLEVYSVGPTMHHKFALIDGKTLLNGSGNWSAAADQRFNEALIVLEGRKSLNAAFADEFERLLSHARRITADGKAGPKPDAAVAAKAPSSRPRNAVFTSLNNDGTALAADKLIAAMNRAKKSVAIMVAHFNSERIAQALIRLHKRRNTNDDPDDDISIRVFLDRGEFDDPKSRVAEIEAAGIEVRYKVYSLGFYFPRAQLMHHKSLIVDQKTLITGSYNWSDTAEHSNYENLVAFGGRSKVDKAIVAAFDAEFQRLWKLNRDWLEAFSRVVLSRKGKRGYKATLPNHFDRPYWDKPLSMSREELAPIMKLALDCGLKGHESSPYFSKNTRRPSSRARGRLVTSKPKAKAKKPRAKAKKPAAKDPEDRAKKKAKPKKKAAPKKKAKAKKKAAPKEEESSGKKTAKPRKTRAY